jgi:polysaccharide biosynthesis/export protein
MSFRSLSISHVIVAFILFLFINGCATTEPASKVIQPPSEEITKEIKFTEFILGPGDTVEITVYRHDDLKKAVQIDTSGKITYPLVGDIQAGGLSIFQLRDKIRDGLSEYIKDPQVSVSVTAVQSQKVYVLGEVGKPGVFVFNTPMSALEAISSAGGFTKDAKDNSVMIIRGNRDNPQLIKLNLEGALKKGNVAQNIQLQGSDIVFVPATFIADASRFSIYLRDILWPILMSEEIIVRGQDVGDVFRGKDVSGTVVIERPPQ